LIVIEAVIYTHTHAHIHIVNINAIVNINNVYFNIIIIDYLNSDKLIKKMI